MRLFESRVKSHVKFSLKLEKWQNSAMILEGWLAFDSLGALGK
jgi:hypothetical protein